MQSLSERLDSFPEPWKPSPGDKLMGLVTDLDWRDSEFDDPYRIVTVEAEDGSTQDGEMIPPGEERAWHAYHAIARSEVAKKNVAVGDRIGVGYHGPAASAAPGKQPAERYRVIVTERAHGLT